MSSTPPLLAVHPFPPAVHWQTSLEMITEVFTDLDMPWIQNYLLRSPSIEDARDILYNYSRSISLAHEGVSIPHLSDGCFQAAFFNKSLSFPCISNMNFIAGLGISCTKTENSGSLIYAKEDQMFRFLIHNGTDSQYDIVLFEGLDSIELTYKAHKNGLYKYSKLKFNQQLFKDAFDDGRKSGHLNFALLNKSLLQSISGAGQYGKQVFISNNTKPHANHLGVLGEQLMEYVFCSYADSIPMIALHTYARTSWEFHFDGEAIRRMRDYGIMERMQNLQIDRVSEMPDGDSTLDRLRQKLSCPQRKNNLNVTKGDGFVNIAPGPGPKRPATAKEERERIRMEKREQRKRKKRLAAARSNERRAAARRRKGESGAL